MSEAQTDVAAAAPTSDDRNLALLVHLGGIILGFIPSLIVYLIKKDNGSAWLLDHTKEALNFQITLIIAYVISWVLMFVLIGLLLMPLLMIAAIVFCIIAALKASSGEAYRFPVSIRLIK